MTLRNPRIALGCALCILFVAPAAAEIGVVFGPEQLVRSSGPPEAFHRTFDVPEFVGEPFLLQIVNGSPDGSHRIEDAVSSGRLLIDGVEVVSPSEFNQTVAFIEKTVSLTVGTHQLEFHAASAPDSFVTVTVLGELLDVTPPLVTAPADLAVAATSEDGTPASDPEIAAFLSSATALDDFDGALEPTHDAPAVFLLGQTVVTFQATDAAGNTGSDTATVTVEDRTPPTVTIASPDPLSVVNVFTITVSGETSELSTVRVNGVAALVEDLGWSADIPLTVGNNVVTAVASDTAGNVGTRTIEVIVDTTPPSITVDHPPEGFTTDAATVDVVGTIGEIVVGTVGGEQVQVSVNGVPAAVANRGFVVADVPLQPGANTLTALAVDQGGNTATIDVVVHREEAGTGPAIRTSSGNHQTGLPGQGLADPIVVALTDGFGNPAPGRTVVFDVAKGDGRLESPTGAGRALAVQTDAAGEARVDWILGTRAGAGTQRVRATAVGHAGSALFVASVVPGSPARVVIEGGDHQVGAAGQPLPLPLVAVVTDADHNRVADVPVTFTILEGGGNLSGAGSSTVSSDRDGRALVVLTLGPEEGIADHVVEASISGIVGAPPVFVSSSRIAGDPADTRVGGVVLDNTDLPIAGVTMHIEGTTLTDVTDAQGHFLIPAAPVGHVHLIADGSTALRPGNWPILAFDLTTVAGRHNTVGMPIYMLPLDLVRGIEVGPTQGGTLTLPELPGLSLTVAPGSATFPDGSDSGVVSITVVHADKVPMPPKLGDEPRLVLTIQPAGVHFDPPAPITLPNSDGMRPGEATDIYSFDHDLVQFVAIGSGTVSEDGLTVRSDPGVGIVKGGWHYEARPPDRRGGACNCSQCEMCDDGRCVPKPDGTPCEDGNACTGSSSCSEGACKGDTTVMNIAAGGQNARMAWLDLLEKCKDREVLKNICEDPLVAQVDVRLGRSRRVECDGVVSDVWIDHFCSDEVDLNDLEALDRIRPCPWAMDSCQSIIHLLAERITGLEGFPYEDAHQAANTFDNNDRDDQNWPGHVIGCFFSATDPIVECKYDDDGDGSPDRQVTWELDESGDITDGRCEP